MGESVNIDSKIKIDIPYFDGYLHIEDYLDWEQAVEVFFEHTDVSEELQVRYVACKLKGGVGAWWETNDPSSAA